MIPGPRPSQGLDHPLAGRDLGLEITGPVEPSRSQPADDVDGTAVPPSPVTLTRTGRGWTVVSPAGTASAGHLVEGLSLADLIAEECGALVEPDRTARRSARGPGHDGGPAEDSPEARIAALQRTVVQLEHALAARVSTERAIGVLAERHRTSSRVAFESLRREARSSGRPVAELAREVLADLEQLDATVTAPFPPGVPVAPSALRPPAAVPSISSSPAAAADGRR